MRKAMLVSLLVLFSVGLSARQRSAALVGPTPLIWIVETSPTYADAAVRYILAGGESVILKSGESASPYLVLTLVPSGSVVQPDNGFGVHYMPTQSQAVAMMLSLPWSRNATWSDGSWMVVYKK